MRNLPHGLDVYYVNVQTMSKIAQIFVAFSEKLNFMLQAGSLKLHPYRLQSFCRMPLSTSDTIWTSGSVSKIGQLIGQLAKKLHPYRLHSFGWM